MVARPIDLFIAGAQKAGTTSLKEYLAQHPQICSHWQMEFMYFYADTIYREGYSRAYKRYFGHCLPHQKVLAKNITVMVDLKAMDRLKAHHPQVKLVLLLRNPVDRAYSAYWFARQQGWETVPSFDEAVWLPPTRHDDPVAQISCAYLDQGIYVKHLQNLYQRFSPDNVMVFLFEEFKDDPVKVCQTIFGVLGLPAFTPDVRPKHNAAAGARFPTLARLVYQPSLFPTARGFVRRVIPGVWRDRFRDVFSRWNAMDFTPPKMNPETRARLLEFYRPYNEQLSKMLGRDLSVWNR